jgi:hypothetical protein
LATIIDSLVVTLGLDPSQFVKNSKTAEETSSKTKKKLTQDQKDMAEQAKKNAEALQDVGVKALSLFGILLGARGVKEFADDLIKSDAALGRLSKNLGESPKVVGAFGLAAEQLGGSADATEVSFQTLSDKIQAAKHGMGQLPNAYAQVITASGHAFDINQKTSEQFFEISEGLQNIAKTQGPAAASFLGRQFLDESTVNLMIKYGGALRGIVAGNEKFAPSEADVKAVQDLQTAWTKVSQELHSLGRYIFDYFAPLMTGITTGIEHILNPTAANKAEDDQSQKRIYSRRPAWVRSLKKYFGMDDADDEPDTAKEPGAASDAGSLTKLIDNVSKNAGIDPRIMEGIRAGESGHGSKYDVKDDDVESSWGPFQLNRRNGLGVEFEKDTGLDVSDPRTIPAQARWVANYIKAHNGTNGQWMGYRGPRDADPQWGDAGYKPMPTPAPPPVTASPQGDRSAFWINDFAKTSLAARSAIAGSTLSNDNRSSTSEMHIGSINVQTQATDANGVAGSLSPALKNMGWTAQANYGPT